MSLYRYYDHYLINQYAIIAMINKGKYVVISKLNNEPSPPLIVFNVLLVPFWCYNPTHLISEEFKPSGFILNLTQPNLP